MQGVILTITYRCLRQTECEQLSKLQPIAADTTVHPGECHQHPVQSLFDDHRDGIKEGVSAAHSQEHQETVCNLVRPGVLMMLSLATDKVPKAHCADPPWLNRERQRHMQPAEQQQKG